MIILIIFLLLSFVVNICLGYFLYRAVKRLLEFDDLYELLVHDLDTNVEYFNKLTSSPLLMNSPEIIEAQHNMSIIRNRLNEYILRMEEISRHQLRKPKSTPPNQPAVL